MMMIWFVGFHFVDDWGYESVAGEATGSEKREGERGTNENQRDSEGDPETDPAFGASFLGCFDSPV